MEREELGMGSCWYKGERRMIKRKVFVQDRRNTYHGDKSTRETGAQALDEITMAQASLEQTQCSSTEHLKHP